MFREIVFTLLAIGFYIECSPRKVDYADHECRRDCLSDPVPRVCEYNFTLEHYSTLSHACFSCPSNHSDCFRPHCVAADGRKRAIKVVNRMMPGPGINVCKGDAIVVKVYNHLGDFEGTSIHWHGLLQEGTPHMDGVTMVTQCPIPAQSMFQYRFLANNAGTHYWHAHAGFQRSDGIYGSVVVRDVQPTNVMTLYDYDLPDHTVIVNDWLDQSTSSKYSLHHHAMDDNTPVSLLINGRSSSYGVGPAMDHSSMGSMEESHTSTTHDMERNMDGHVSSEAETGDSGGSMEDHGNGDVVYAPKSVFKVTAGSRYRFRFISNGILNCPLRISIEDHTLTVIASDGYDMEPFETQAFTIFAGERYDVVLSANQNIGNYWMYVVGLGDCEGKQLYETAILRYHGAGQEKPSTMTTYAKARQTQYVVNDLMNTHTSGTVAGLTSSESIEDIYTSHDIRRFYVAMDFNKVGSSTFLDDEYYPLKTMMQIHQGPHANHMYTLQMNHITNRLPASPLLTQYSDLSEDIFCNETFTTKDCTAEYCECVYRIKVNHNDVIELVMVSEARHGLGNHPMHLHGHAFFVLGMETLNKTITRRYIENLDVRGKLRRNFKNPIKKDTVIVPDGGYTIIRFKASNLGFWLFHCHVEFHMALGMSLVLQVGESHEMPPAPPGFPRCGNWAYPEYLAGARTSGSSSLQPFVLTYVAVIFISSFIFIYTFNKKH